MASAMPNGLAGSGTRLSCASMASAGWRRSTEATIGWEGRLLISGLSSPLSTAAAAATATVVAESWPARGALGTSPLTQNPQRYKAAPCKPGGKAEGARARYNGVRSLLGIAQPLQAPIGRQGSISR